MITDDEIMNIVDGCRNAGYEVGLRDISFSLLSMMYANDTFAYRTVFGNDDKNYNAYVKDGKVTYLKSYIKANVVNAILFGKRDEESKTSDITFDENKAEMIALIKAAQDALENNEIEAKDALKIQADLRIKLNDKFKVNADVKDSVVFVEQKYNSVCEYCGHEIYIPTEEELIKKFNLIRKQ